MVLGLYEPWKILNQLQKEVENAVNRYQTQSDSTVATSNWIPAVDIKETADNFLIFADIPGVEPDQIEVTMENGLLTLKGERKTAQQIQEKEYKRVERLHGTFYRRFTLPDTADAEKIQATCRQGVLEITIPKKEAAQPKKITVEVH